MNEPLEWELVPQAKGKELDIVTHRALVDGQGWIVVIEGGMNRTAVFVPDPSGMWGREPEKHERKSRWD